MAAHARNRDDILVALEAGVNRPQHVIRIEDINILVDQNDMLQLAKCAEGDKRGLALTALVGRHGLLELDDCKVLAAARGMAVHVLHAAGKRGFLHAKNARLGRNARHAHMLLGRADASLDNRMLAIRDGLHLNYRHRGIRRTGIARELRHGLASTRVLVLDDTFAAHKLALDNELGIRDSLRINGYAIAKLDSLSAQRTGNLQLVETIRGGRSLEAGSNLDGRVNADAYGNRQVLAKRLGLREHSADMAATRNHVHRNLVLVLKTQAMNRNVLYAGLRIGGISHAERNVRTSIFLGVLRRREDLADVEVFVSRIFHDFLAWSRTVDDDRRNRRIHRIAQEETELARFAVKQVTHALTSCKQADGNAHIREVLDVVEQQRRTSLGRTHNRSTSTNMPIHTRDLGISIHLGIGVSHLPINPLQQFNCRPQAINHRTLLKRLSTPQISNKPIVMDKQQHLR